MSLKNILFVCFLAFVTSNLANANTNQQKQRDSNVCIERFRNRADNQWLYWQDMRNCNIGDDDIPELLNIMNSRKFDGQLFLSGNRITSKGALMLSKYQYDHSYNLDHNPIGNEGLMSFLDDQHIRWLIIGYNHIDDQAVNQFVQNMYKTKIRSIGLLNFNLNDASLKALANNTNVKRLEISHSSLSDKDVYTLSKSRSIRELYLNNDNLNLASLDILSKQSTLEELSLNNNNIDDSGAKILAQHGNLRTLIASYNHITSNGLKMLLQSKSIFMLYLNYNDIKDTELNLVKNNTIEYLYLMHNKIGNKIAIAISKNLSNVSSLGLSYNLIGNEGFNSLTSMRELTNLYLRHNLIDDGITFGNIIHGEYHDYQEIDLGENKIGKNGLKAFDIKYYSYSRVKLDHNQIGDAGLVEYAKGQNRNTISDLSLEYNNIGDEGVIAVAMSDRKFSILNLSHNLITDIGAFALADINSPIWMLSIGYNKLSKKGVDALKNSRNIYNLNIDGNVYLRSKH